MKKNILIFDYGSGNYSSIYRTIKRFNNKVEIGNSKKKLRKSDVIILPGVGTFPKAMEKIKKNSILKDLKSIIKKGKDILGICLGMQLFSESSPEIENTIGLKLLEGKTKQLPFENHIGWNKVNFKSKSIFKYLDGKSFYFQHQYYIDSKYKYEKGFFKIRNKNFIAMIKKKNILGVQFHPEKSQSAGLDFFKIYFESLND